jgi:hypothetical protein
MTTKERQNVRGALLAAGFRRDNTVDEPNSYDRGNGIYTEVWRSYKDRSKITLDWDKKTPEDTLTPPNRGARMFGVDQETIVG